MRSPTPWPNGWPSSWRGAPTRRTPTKTGGSWAGAAVGLKERLRRLEERAEGGVVSIPQRDGTTARFPKDALRDSFLNLMARLSAGEDASPEHPLIEAVRNSGDPKWSGTVWEAGDPDEWTEPVEDLSE